MALPLNRSAYNQLLRADVEWLLQQPRSLARDHIEHVLRHQLRGTRLCPKCGADGEMFTADLDWCPKCKHQWSGT